MWRWKLRLHCSEIRIDAMTTMVDRRTRTTDAKMVNRMKWARREKMSESLIWRSVCNARESQDTWITRAMAEAHTERELINITRPLNEAAKPEKMGEPRGKKGGEERRKRRDADS